MRQRPMAQPEGKLPAMLKRPMSESDQAPTAGGRPQSATTPGRCVAMKATWKPQTKNPAVRRRKLRSRDAARPASPRLAEVFGFALPRLVVLAGRHRGEGHDGERHHAEEGERADPADRAG